MGLAGYEELIAYPEVLREKGLALWLRMLDVHERVLHLRSEGWAPSLISESCGVPLDLIERVEEAGPLPFPDGVIEQWLTEDSDGPA